MCLRSLEDKLQSLTLAVSDTDFRNLPRPELNLISESCGGWKEHFLARTKRSSFCPAAARSISAHTAEIFPFHFMQK
ncbi:hypothetical protein CEXT_375281 [Caerostris extrusa]|uniref:Uncharacterized protein n=1 Tax=Caerostris extrusa TaxID=172846 RepID=A0AAV4XGC4_CAEEX|nr:hypothetical protein CEXT_375281 [Caerostris extrusa]